MFLYLQYCFFQGGDDPNWIYNFIFDALCARSVILRIKVDEYNLAPKFGRRFTVSKYLGDSSNSVTKPTIIPGVGNQKNLSSCVVSDIKEDDETEEMYSRITQDEWDMSDELLWGPRISSVKSTSSMALVYIFLH